jgi:uncharacterized protein YbcV (DUF1398 family)
MYPAVRQLVSVRFRRMATNVVRTLLNSDASREREETNVFSKMTRQRVCRGVFRSIVDLQTAINAYLAEHNASPNRSSGPNPPRPLWPNLIASL